MPAAKLRSPSSAAARLCCHAPLRAPLYLTLLAVSLAQAIGGRGGESGEMHRNVYFHAGNYNEAAGHYTVALHQLPRGQGAPRCACGCLNTLRCVVWCCCLSSAPQSTLIRCPCFAWGDLVPARYDDFSEYLRSRRDFAFSVFSA